MIGILANLEPLATYSIAKNVLELDCIPGRWYGKDSKKSRAAASETKEPG
jgi:hypothetical protein